MLKKNNLKTIKNDIKNVFLSKKQNKQKQKPPTGGRGLCCSVDKLQAETDGLGVRAQISMAMLPYELHMSCRVLAGD